MQQRLIPFLTLLLGLVVGTGRVPVQVPTPRQSGEGDYVKLKPSEIEIYEQASTVINWDRRQIQDNIHKLQPAENQDQLPMLLERTGQTVNGLIRDLPRISCDEEFESDSIQLGVRDSQHHKFRYIVIPHPEDIVPTFEEYRTDLNGKSLNASKYRHLPLVTYGFISAVLLLSPSDQSEAHFRYFGIQKVHDRVCYVLGVAQDPAKAHRVGRFSVLDKSCGILLQGLAWVDTSTYDIVKINTWLLAPRMDAGLRGQASQVEFSPTPIADSRLVLSLPSKVGVVVACGELIAHNSHVYSNYKLFRTESSIRPIP